MSRLTDMAPRFLLLFLLLLPTSALHSQGIRGWLVEEGTDVAVVGALLVLQDSVGKRVAQGVSGSEGRFSLKAPAPGAYLLRVLRIGFLPFDSQIELHAGESLNRNVLLTGAAISLPEISIAGTSMCGDRAWGDTLSSALWTQAGTALAITAQTVKSHAYRFLTVLEDRDIDRTGEVSSERHAPATGISAWPVRSPSPGTLLASGFIENLEDLQSGPTWYGPDPEFLLSESFFSGHCFRAVPPGPDDSPEWVGLAFEPGFQDHRADVRGILWLDRRTAELRRLDFGYTRLPTWARGTDAGGALGFAPLPGGGWIVQRWSLRVPVPEVDVGTGRVSVTRYRESGGHVGSVLASNGALIERYPP